MSTQLHGTWRCIKRIGRGKEEDRKDPIYTFNPDGSATSKSVTMPMYWGILDGQIVYRICRTGGDDREHSSFRDA
jgi:hypothetical protein